MLLFLLSCQNKVKRPEALLEKQDFAAILSDLHLLESTYMTGRGVPDSSREAYLQDYNLVFQIHHIEPSVFFKNFAYYKDNPELMNEIYELVNERLQIMEDQMLIDVEGGH